MMMPEQTWSVGPWTFEIHREGSRFVVDTLYKEANRTRMTFPTKAHDSVARAETAILIHIDNETRSGSLSGWQGWAKDPPSRALVWNYGVGSRVKVADQTFKIIAMREEDGAFELGKGKTYSLGWFKPEDFARGSVGLHLRKEALK